jgi:alpha-ketoglutarate-dependent taurine dioxygenase
MLTHLVTDLRAWRASTIDECGSWYYPLSERCLADLDDTIRQLRREPRTITELRVSSTPCARCAEDFQPALAALEAGRGFVIVEGLAGQRYSALEQQVIYWLVGQLLGQPVVQNVQGTLLYDVRDTGQDVRYGARFSVTNAETGFHTDNSFGEAVVDYVGLLCLRGARSGGTSQIVSGWTAYDRLLAEHPDVVEQLAQPVPIERRGGVRAGEAATIRFPVVQRHGDGLLYRYLRYWIETGHQKAGEPMSASRRRAFDLLDECLARPELRVDFLLKPGGMLFVNNRWILHNRTAFEDHAEPEKKRHLIRLWLRARES